MKGWWWNAMGNLIKKILWRRKAQLGVEAIRDYLEYTSKQLKVVSVSLLCTSIFFYIILGGKHLILSMLIIGFTKNIWFFYKRKGYKLLGAFIYPT